MRRLLVAAAAALLLCGPAHAAIRHDAFPLHPGSPHVRASYGQRVKALQWVLAGHRPNLYREIKPTFKGKPNGLYGPRTKRALLAYKYRLGYPKKGECGATRTLLVPTVTPWFFRLLKGKVKRSPCWLTVAAARVAAVNTGGFSKVGFAVKKLELRWLGITEDPLGSNGGPCISIGCVWDGQVMPALQSGTGAYWAAWCVSTQQTAFGMVGYGHFANDSASVYYVLDYAAQRNWVHVKAKVGALVAFVDYDSRGFRIPGSGHMGYVTKVTATGFASIEGNEANGVHEVYHDLVTRHPVFIYLPGVS